MGQWEGREVGHSGRGGSGAVGGKGGGTVGGVEVGQWEGRGSDSTEVKL